MTIRLAIGIGMLIFVLVSWPMAIYVFAKDEPPFVIALSELALLYEAYTAIQVAWDAKKKKESDG